ncbi:MAG TPA: SUMF1/EgtB/PvdO family nonheme iron enzyme [Polyangiaceae bacterium]
MRAHAKKDTLRPLERITLPTGPFRAGSEPGDPGRMPDAEPRLQEVELGGYEVDRLPYPNDPTKPPLVNVGRDEAERLCTERGQRLCTELEWERACKGPANDRYPTGRDWDASCANDLLACATGYGALGMGTRLREWTRSELPGAGGKTLAVVRGAAASDKPEAHRCAARTNLAPETQSDTLGFRCCAGAPNARKLPEPQPGVAYRKHALGADKLAALLKDDPTTQGLVKDLKLFREPESAETVVSRGPGDRKGFSFTVSPLLWNPVAGAEFLVVSARSGENTSFVVAFYALGDERYRLAASFMMKNEPGPVALAYTDDIRPRLHFSSCWGCPGETGKILFRRPERVAIVQP